MMQSIKNAITDENTNIIEAIQDYIRDEKKITLIQENKELTEEMNGLTNLSAEDVRSALQDLVDVAGANGEFIADIDLYEKYGSGDGYSYVDLENSDGNKIGINVRKVDIADDNKVINIVFHETTNTERHNINEQTAINRGNTAEAIWDMLNYGNANTNTMTGSQWLEQNINSMIILQGNANYLTNTMKYVYENSANIKIFNQSNNQGFVFDISKNGEKFIIKEEGKVFGVAGINEDGTKNNLHLEYYDGIGKETIGYGHLLIGNEKEEYIDGIDDIKANEIFTKDLDKIEKLMALTLIRQTEQQQTDAIGSAIFNLGPQFFIKKYENEKAEQNVGAGNFDYSQIANGITNTFRILNNDINRSVDPVKIKATFAQWNGAKNTDETTNERITKEIEKRREKEADLYNNNSYGDLNIAPYNSYKNIKLVNIEQIKLRTIIKQMDIK
jgi:GH24 family phage-related lysozyme (muramidase)